MRLLIAIFLLLLSLTVPTSKIFATDSEPRQCDFILGFATLKDLIDRAEGTEKVGDCLEDQRFNPENGDALQ